MGLETAAIIGIGAAAASAAGTTAMAVSQNKAQKRANETNVQLQSETNALNYKMFQEQLGFTEQMQDKQNLYNKPSAQRERLQEAGINPYLAMSAINSGNSELASTPSPNPAGAARVEPEYNNILGSLLQDLGLSASRVNEYQMMSEQINAQREAVKRARIENYYLGSEKAAEIDKKIAETQKLLADKSLTEDKRKEIQASIRKMKIESRGIRLNNEFLRKTMLSRTKQEERRAALLDAQERLEVLRGDYQELTNEAFPALNASQLKLLSGQAFQAVMAGNLSKSGAELNKTINERESIKKIGDVIDNGIKAGDFTLKSLGITSAQLQALRDGKILENLNQSAISNWIDNILYYTKTTMPSVPVGFIKGLK